MLNINPKILEWARETSGLSFEQAAHKLGLKDTKTKTAIEKLEELEINGQVSRSQLEKIAKVYRRPLITFYLGSAPTKANKGQDFRKINNARGCTR